jgi:hypothetical protein
MLCFDTNIQSDYRFFTGTSTSKARNKALMVSEACSITEIATLKVSTKKQQSIELIPSVPVSIPLGELRVSSINTSTKGGKA